MSARRLQVWLNTPGRPNAPIATQVAQATGLTLQGFAYVTENLPNVDIQLSVTALREGGVAIAMGPHVIQRDVWPMGQALEFTVPDIGTFKFLAGEASPVRLLPVLPPTTTPAPTTTTAAPTTTTTAAPVQDVGFFRYTVAIDGYEFLSGDEVRLVNADTKGEVRAKRLVTPQEILDGRASFIIELAPEFLPLTVMAEVYRGEHITLSKPVRVPAAGAVPKAPFVGQPHDLVGAVEVPTLSPEVEIDPPAEPELAVSPPEWRSTLPPTTTAAPPTTTTTTTTLAPMPDPIVDVVQVRNWITHNQGMIDNAQAVVDAIGSTIRVDDLESLAGVLLQDDIIQAAASLQAIASEMPEKEIAFRMTLTTPWDLSPDTPMATIKLGAEVASATLADYLSNASNAAQMAAVAAYVFAERYKPLSTQRVKDESVKSHVRLQSHDAYLRMGRAYYSGEADPAKRQAIVKEIGRAEGSVVLAQLSLEGARQAMSLRGKESTHADILRQASERMPQVLTGLGQAPGDVGYFRDHADAVTKVVDGVSVPKDLSRAANQQRYGFAKNRSMYDAGTMADLARHGSVTTNPKVKGAMDQAAATAQAKAEASGAAAASAESDVKGQGGTPAAPANTVDPNNQNVLMKALGALFRPSGMPNIEVSGGVVETPLIQGVAGVGDKLRTSITRVTAEPTTSALNITNMFDVDFNDFRRTGIVKALYNLQGVDGNTNNRDNLASIMVVDQTLQPDEKGSIVQPMEPIPGYGIVKSYNNFMLTGVRESYAEKAQIIETLGEGVAGFFFGMKAEVWSITGVLINDLYSDQVHRFRKLYKNVLRGSVLAKNRQKAAISVPASGLLIRGYPIALDLPHESANEELVQFTMQIWVTEVNTTPLISLVKSDEERTFVATMTVLDGGAVKGGANVAAGLQKYLRTPNLRADQTAQERILDANASLYRANGTGLEDSIIKRGTGYHHGGQMSFGDPHGHAAAKRGELPGGGTASAKHAGSVTQDGSKTRPQAYSPPGTAKPLPNDPAPRS